MEKAFVKRLFDSHQKCPSCPSPESVGQFYNDLLGTLFPDFSAFTFNTEEELGLHLDILRNQLADLMRYTVDQNRRPNDLAKAFFDQLPKVYESIDQDIDATFFGDPAAKNRSEVIRSYPGFYAIAAYRIAHELHRAGVPDIPRIITEQAHSKTGIDIHPGAKIGTHFCIDHGTGVVIGETTRIGDHVKIYQGVTLGALSVNKEDAEKKRHPTIEDHVVIYAGVTILGGETVIGKGSIIGGNVWLTKSVPPNSKIYYQAKMYNGDTEQTDLYIFKGEKS